MIASITRGRDAGALGVYLHGPGRHNEHAYNNRVHGMVIAGSVSVTDPTKPGQWVANMRRAYRGRDDVVRPVWQCSLRTASEDRRLSDAEWADAAQVFAERLGFDQHPWVAVRHADDHIHLAVSRVAHDGRVWLGRHDYRATQDARRALEVDLGLTQAPLRRGVASERTLITQVQPGEYRMFADAGRHSPRVVLAGAVLAAANTAAGHGRDVFEAELTERGVDFAVNQATTTGTVSGYRFAAPTTVHADSQGEQVWFKASQLDKKLAWRQLSQVLEPLPPVLGEQEFTRRHTAELEQRAQQGRAGRIAEQWADTGNPPVEQITATLSQARTQLGTLDPQLTAARGVVEQQVRAAASELGTAQQQVYSAGRLGRSRAQHRFDQLAATHSERLGVPVTGPDGRQRSYTAIFDQVLTTHHGDLLAQRAHWAQVAATSTAQMAVWEKIQQNNPDHGAYGAKAVRLAMMFERDSPQQRAYRTYLSELPAPLVYPEGEPDPVGAQLLTHLADPDIREHRQQRLQQNLEAIGAYQHHRTPPPATRTTRRTPPAPGRYTPPAANRNQDRGRGR